MPNETVNLVLPVLRVDSEGKRLVVSVRRPLCDRSFNQSISLGKNGYPFVSYDGRRLVTMLEKSIEGLKLFSADRLADDGVRSVRLTYRPIHISNDGLHTEVKLLNIEAREADSSEWIDEPIDEGALAAAISQIKSSLRSDVSFVYFIKAKNNPTVKIGVSRNPLARLAQLSTGAFDELEIIGTISGTPRLEKALHAVFADRRLNGEWFKFDSTINALVSTLPELECQSRPGSHHSSPSRSTNHSTAETLIEQMRSLIPQA